jgi:CDP-diacylglycerol--serine O-phosphatidyltransferase
MFLKVGPKRTGEIPIAALVPNFITTLSMCSGLASIHFSLIKHWEPAVGAIALAMVFDALDGRAARLLRVSSKFGAVLDSLSDFVSFGVAPAIILHEWLLAPAMTPVELAAVMIYAMCAGLRLARFTAAVPTTKQPHAPSSNYFTGMPTPAAAAAVMIPAMYNLSNVSLWIIPQWAIVLLSLTIGFLMVSRVPTFAFKKLTIQRRLVIPVMILLCLVVVSMATHFWFTLVVISALNVLLIPFAWAMRARTRSGEESLRLAHSADSDIQKPHGDEPLRVLGR